MSDTLQNNKRIAKNTLLLYVRMLFTMGVSLYTSRIILQALGVQDYGIYNVVGGVVAMFTMFSGSLSTAISRYLTFELGRQDYSRLKKIFCTSVNVQLILGAFILLLVETIGTWFLNNKMDIPSDRLFAANIVLHLSALTFFINLLSIPYNASIIAHEKMSAFAYIGIIEALLKLLISYLILWNPIDKLIYYALLMASLSLLIRFLYGVYCKRSFQECTYHLMLDKALLKDMTSFAGWNFFGNTAYILNTQGVNMLINVFFGVTFNAAQGIASQAQGALLQFVGNFTTAINPQITKSYASGNKDYLFTLICKGAKYTFFLLMIITLPFIVETDYILKLWLGNPPEYAAVFLRLMIFSSFMTIMGNTSLTAINANGNIKNYQMAVTSIGCLVFPLTWIFYQLNFSVVTTYYIYIVIYFVLILVRTYYLKRLLNFPPMLFIKKVLFPAFLVFIPSVMLSALPSYFLASSFSRLIISLFTIVISSLVMICLLGIDKSERNFLLKTLKIK